MDGSDDLQEDNTVPVDLCVIGSGKVESFSLPRGSASPGLPRPSGGGDNGGLRALRSLEVIGCSPEQATSAAGRGGGGCRPNGRKVENGLARSFPNRCVSASEATQAGDLGSERSRGANDGSDHHRSNSRLLRSYFWQGRLA